MVPDVLRRVGLDHGAAVQGHFPLKCVQVPLKNRHRGHMMPVLHVRRGKNGEALGISRQTGCPVQVNMALILPEMDRVLFVEARQGSQGIAMEIKHREIH